MQRGPKFFTMGTQLEPLFFGEIGDPKCVTLTLSDRKEQWEYLGESIFYHYQNAPGWQKLRDRRSPLAQEPLR